MWVQTKYRPCRLSPSGATDNSPHWRTVFNGQREQSPAEKGARILWCLAGQALGQLEIRMRFRVPTADPEVTTTIARLLSVGSDRQLVPWRVTQSRCPVFSLASAVVQNAPCRRVR